MATINDLLSDTRFPIIVKPSFADTEYLVIPAENQMHFFLLSPANGRLVKKTNDELATSAWRWVFAQDVWTQKELPEPCKAPAWLTPGAMVQHKTHWKGVYVGRRGVVEEFRFGNKPMYYLNPLIWYSGEITRAND